MSPRRFCIEAIPASAASQLQRGDARTFKGFSEAEALEGGTFKVLLLTEGPGNKRDKNYYTRRAIEQGARHFEGARSFLNHQSAEEEWARPEQDVNQLCGYFTDVKVVEAFNETGKKVAGLEAIFHPDASEPGQSARAKALAAIEFSKLYPGQGICYAGLSINADGVKEGSVVIDGEEWNNITDFANVRSVDVVTRPARGGAFVALMESEALNLTPTAWRAKMKTLDQKVKELREAKAALRANTDATKTRTLEAAVAEKAKAVQMLLEAEDESKKEADGEDEKKTEAEKQAEADAAKTAAMDDGKEPDGDEPEPEAEADGEDEKKEDDTADADAPDPKAIDDLKKMVPRGSDESEADFGKRLGGIHDAMKAHFGGKPGEEKKAEAKKEAKAEAKTEAAEESSVEEFKRKAPGLYSRVRESVRKQLGEQKLDFAKVKVQLSEALLENRVLKSRALAERKLRESNIPADFLTSDDLVGRSEKEMTSTIERTKKLMRGEVHGGEAPRGAATHESDVADGFDGLRIARKTKP